MSHFAVVVIGDNPEEQLAPFHEFECTGQNDQYVRDIDITEEVRADFARNEDKNETFAQWVDGYYGYKVITEGETPQTDGDKAPHKYGYAVVDAEGNLVKAVRRTNPDAKWDWYKMGGRWAGFFKAKNVAEGVTGSPGLMTPPAEKGYVDQTTKGNIDFEAMRQEAAAEAADRYDRMDAIVGHLPMHRSWKGDILENEFKTLGREKAIELYHSQERIVALKESKDDELRWCDMDDFACTREEYIQKAINRTAVPFAMVIDGVWYEKGEMGWWAMVSNEMDQNEWNRKVTEQYNELPDDTLITMVDCHI